MATATSGLPFAVLAMLLAGCSGGGGGDSGTDGADAGPEGSDGTGGSVGVNGTVGNGTGNGTGEMPIEEPPCEDDAGYQSVGGYYVKAQGNGTSVYQESNGMPDAQTEDTCPENPDTKVQSMGAGRG